MENGIFEKFKETRDMKWAYILHHNCKIYIYFLLLLFHMYYLYTICLLAAFRMSPVSLGTDVTSSREHHSSSFVSSSFSGFPDRSFFPAANPWSPLSLYHNNFSDVDSG